MRHVGPKVRADISPVRAWGPRERNPWPGWVPGIYITRMRAVGPHRLPGQRRVSDLRGPSARVFGGGDANPARHRAFSPEADWADIGSDLRPEERGGCPGVVSDLLRVGIPYFSQAEPKMGVDRGRGAW